MGESLGHRWVLHPHSELFVSESVGCRWCCDPNIWLSACRPKEGCHANAATTIAMKTGYLPMRYGLLARDLDFIFCANKDFFHILNDL